MTDLDFETSLAGVRSLLPSLPRQLRVRAWQWAEKLVQEPVSGGC